MENALDPDLIYLNHAAVAPWPATTAGAVTRFAQENAQRGAAGYLEWAKKEQSLRERMARLVNAPSPDDIALLKSTSEALSVVAWGLDWNAGDNIVSFAGEFPSNRVVWESLGALGVELRLAPIDPNGDAETGLIALCDEDTRLIAISSVQYASGFRCDLERIGRFCREQDILFCVDAIQSLGALPFDAQAIGADFVMADGHKWMLGPEGLALFYCRAALRDRLKLHQYGWHMVEHMHEFDRSEWEPAHSARRFECGSPNMIGAHALHASLSYILETGIDVIGQAVLEHTAHMHELADRHGFEALSPPHPARQSGIFTFRVPGRDSVDLYARLMDRGVICASRGGGIRFSPHFYTPAEKIEQAFAIAAGLSGL